jgi:hypothetical protein
MNLREETKPEAKTDLTSAKRNEPCSCVTENRVAD